VGLSDSWAATGPTAIPRLRNFPRGRVPAALSSMQSLLGGVVPTF